MKYTYTGHVPTVCLVNGDLIQVNKGEVVEVDQPPSPEFLLVETPIVQAPLKKSKKGKVVKNATTANTSSVG
tara:strand:- start:85 stop:300 length:216 start_codon:yes stop_codon:yes gene_type:complete